MICDVKQREHCQIIVDICSGYPHTHIRPTLIFFHRLASQYTLYTLYKPYTLFTLYTHPILLPLYPSTHYSSFPLISSIAFRTH